jgi:cytoskeleton protein RodZ
MRAEARAGTPSAGFSCAVCGARLDATHVDVGPTGTLCSFCGSPQGRTSGQPDLKLVVSNDGHRAGGLDALKTARTERGETLEQAARFTRIRPAYLRALEDGDTSSLAPYPGRSYARYFLREYAEHLGLEPGPLLRGFDQEEPAVQPMPPPAPIRQRRPRAWRWAVGAAVLLIGLLVANALLPRGDEQGEQVAPRSHHSSAPSAQVSPPAVQHVPPVPPDGVRAVIHTTAPCWIRVVVDGSTVLEKTLKADKTVRFDASDRLDLSLGNAGGVTLEVNGRSIPTGMSGEVREMSFVWHDDHVIVS